MAKRRSNGEGNIRKRKDGRWEGRYTTGFDPVTGKKVFKNVLDKTQTEVKEKLKKALEESQKLDFNRTRKYTVSQWMEEWFENGQPLFPPEAGNNTGSALCLYARHTDSAPPPGCPLGLCEYGLA